MTYSYQEPRLRGRGFFIIAAFIFFKGLKTYNGA